MKAYSPHSVRLALATALALTLGAGCHTGTSGTDAGAAPDGSRDGAPRADAASGSDAGPGTDAAASTDAGDVDGGTPATRDPYRQPFATNSIWNMPIGSDAVYVPANMRAVPGGDPVWALPFSDTDDIALTPTAPAVDLLHSDASWDPHGDRCVPSSPTDVMATIHVPDDFIVPHSAFNEAFAFLDADGRTLIQGEPLGRCTAGGPATSLVLAWPTADLYGDGIVGGHGGSGMSTLGGTLRLGELRPGDEGPHHVLKFTVYMKEAYQCDGTDAAPCNRWPAPHADGYAVGFYGTGAGNPNVDNAAFRMGALLALPANVDLDSLGLMTEPGRQLAWTLQNYGAYADEDSYGPSFYIGTEYSPDGRFTEQFEHDYGFPFNQSSDYDSEWTRDLQRLLPHLAIVDNNGPTSIGGGGTPRQPLAPEIAP